MKFSDIEAIPAMVVDVNDEEGKGRVKVAAMNSFNPSAQGGIENARWIYPFSMSGFSGQFSHPSKGDMVWMMNNTSNYNEYWYMPYFKQDVQASSLADTDANNEVIMSNTSAGTSTQVYYNDNEGLQMKNGTTGLSMDNQGNAKLKGSAGSIDISNNQVKIGKSDTPYVSSVNGDKLNEVINQFANYFDQLYDNTFMDGHLSPLSEIFNQMSEYLRNIGSDENAEILCKNTKIN